MHHTRSSGVLLHIASLNGPFGIGVMGQEGRDFVLKLRRMGFHLWQVLPLGIVDHTGSPYASPSAFAGNLAFIDPRELLSEGLVTAQEVEENKIQSPFAVKHKETYEKRFSLLKKAFGRIGDTHREMMKIFAQQNSWVEDYAFFAVLKEKNGNLPWWQWKEEFKFYEKAQKHKSEFQKEIDFYIFTQFVFYSQWRSLKEFANEQGVSLFGDMPIYVSRDSTDVWANTELFDLDENLSPKCVAGVPPDYFSENGQKWGNPLYAWDKMEKDGFKWWLQRISFSMKIYDKIRIDHFRAFASYWAVPLESETAKVGQWQKGPGMKLFSLVKEKMPRADIVAEDLGLFGEDVVKLLSDTGFPGMRVVQFGFDPHGNSTHLPHNYEKNTVAYVGTHDNNTILGWLWEATEQERAFALRYCCFGGTNWGDGGAYSGSCRAVTECVWRSSADTAIIAVQDMCGFGRDARMNTPGTDSDNWTFRVSNEALESIDEGYFNEINSVYRR